VSKNISKKNYVKLIKSSFWLYELKAGDFTTYAESDLIDAKLLGYYPLVLFDGSEMIITQVLPDSTLPPLILQKEPKTEKYTQFMGGNLNIDNKNENFVLKKTLLAKNVPRISFTASLQFDIIGILSHLEFYKTIRFNLYELTLTNQVGNNVTDAYQIVKVSIDLAYKKTGETPNSNGFSPPWPDGEVEIIINLTFGGNVSSSSKTMFISKFKSNKLSEIRNLESMAYLGSNENAYNFQNIMGTQTLLFSVFCPL
jgi:hypothetical protein